MFQTAEGISSDDEADGTGLSEEDREGICPGPERRGEAGRGEGPGFEEETEFPGPKARRKKNRGRSRYGAGRRERRRRKALQWIEATRLVW